MERVFLTQEFFKDWDRLCEESDDAWFWHTLKWQEALVAHAGGSVLTQRSFLVSHGGNCIAICPLFLHKLGGANELGGGWHGMVPALSPHITRFEREKTLKFIFEEIDRIAQESSAWRVTLRSPVLNASYLDNSERSNILMKYGYLDASLNTQLIRLERTLEALRRDVRHGHSADITRGTKALSFIICEKGSCTDDMYESYVALHERVAGYKKGERTAYFKVMRDILNDGNAFLAGASYKGHVVGFAYFIVYKSNVYFASSCNDPKYETFPITHFLQWESMKYMQAKHYRWYELGLQQYGPTLAEVPSEKEINISRFKRGFGGQTLPLFRGEKYYDKDFFKDTFTQRIGKYYEAQFSKK